MENAEKPVSSDPALRELFLRYQKDRDQETRNQLVTAHLPLAHMVARRYAGKGVEYEDLVQIGSLALIGAVEKYDPSLETPFPVYAVKTLLGEVKHYFRDKLSSVRISRSHKELAKKIAETRDAMTAELMRAPYLDELSVRMQLPVEDLVEAMEAANTQYPVSLEQKIGEEDESLSLSEVFGREEAGYNDVEMREWFSRLMSGLSGQEREVIRQRYELGYSQRQVASNLKVSQMYVSRLERKILSMLRNNA